MEKVKKEICPKCKSENLINYIYCKTGQNIIVYVECANCHIYITRYSLLTYSSDKPCIELSKRLNCLEYTSGKKMLHELKEHSKNIESEFNHIRALCRTEYKK